MGTKMGVGVEKLQTQTLASRGCEKPVSVLMLMPSSVGVCSYRTKTRCSGSLKGGGHTLGDLVG